MGHRHLRLYPIQNGRTEKISPGQFVHLTPSIPEHHRSFSQPLFNPLQHPVPVLCPNQRSLCGSLVQSVAHADGIRRLLQQLHETVSDRLHRNHHTTGHTPLPGAAKGRTGNRPNRAFQMGIHIDNVMVFGSRQGLNSLPESGRRLVHIFRHRLGAHEGNGVDSRMSKKGVHRLLPPVHQIQHPFGNTGFCGQFHQPDGGQGRSLGGLQDKSVSGGQGEGDHPQRNHHRKVEGRDSRHHPDRIPHHLHVNPPGHLGRHFPLHQGGHSGGEFHHFDSPPNFSPGLAQGFSVFLRHRLGQAVHLLHQPLPKPVQNAYPLRYGFLLPRLEGSLGGLHRCVHIGLRGKRHLSEDLLRRRIGNRQYLPGL